MSNCVFALLLGVPQLPAQGQSLSTGETQGPSTGRGQTATPFTISQTNKQPYPQPDLQPAPLFLSATAAQIERLDAAVLTVDRAKSPERKINTLRRLAKAYSAIDEQARAVQMLDQAVLIAEQSLLATVRTAPNNTAPNNSEGTGQSDTDQSANSQSDTDQSATGQSEMEEAIAQQLEQTTEPAILARRYIRLTARIASDYSSIGETEAAQSLLEKATDELALTLSNRFTGGALGDLAEAYALIDDPDITPAGLATLLELVTNADLPIGGNGRPFVPIELITAYGQLGDAAVANEGLSKLLEITLNRLDAEGNSGRFSLEKLSAFATAYGKQNNVEAATQLLTQSMALVRNSDKNYKSRFYQLADIAAAYGYLGDTAAAEQGLAEIVEIVQTTDSLSAADLPAEGLSEAQELFVTFTRIYDDIAPLTAVAIAHGQLGNLSQAQEILDALSARLQVFDESSNLLLLEALAQTYQKIGDVPGQQAVLQQMFDNVPKLRRESAPGLNIADVTPGYLGIGALLKGYVEIENDAIAQKNLKILEDFFKEIRFDERGFSGQLSDLAAAVIARGDEEAAHRLMTEAVEIVGTPADQLIPDDPRFNVTRAGMENFAQAQNFTVLSRLARNYSGIQNEQLKAAGLEALRKVAADKLTDPERKAEMDDLITQSYAGI